MAAMKRCRRRTIIALVGGIANRVAHDIEIDGKVRHFASSKEGGAGELRRLLASIKSGGLDEVWILICWIGHSESRAIEKACRKHGIPVWRIRGLGQARRRGR